MQQRSRDVYVSSLTVGRCFTISPNAKKEEDPNIPKGSFRLGKAIMTPSMVWKVLVSGEEEVRAANVSGDEEAFEPGLLVVEIPREGYERLVQRNGES